MYYKVRKCYLCYTMCSRNDYIIWCYHGMHWYNNAGSAIFLLFTCCYDIVSNGNKFGNFPPIKHTHTRPSASECWHRQRVASISLLLKLNPLASCIAGVSWLWSSSISPSWLHSVLGRSEKFWHSCFIRPPQLPASLCQHIGNTWHLTTRTYFLMVERV